jgi:hypothetical protein
VGAIEQMKRCVSTGSTSSNFEDGSGSLPQIWQGMMVANLKQLISLTFREFKFQATRHIAPPDSLNNFVVNSYGI